MLLSDFIGLLHEAAKILGADAVVEARRDNVDLRISASLGILKQTYIGLGSTDFDPKSAVILYLEER